MPTIPTDPPLPGILPLSPRLRLHPNFNDSTSDDSTRQMATREQLLRAKQLLLQLKELNQSSGQFTQDTVFTKNLALIRLTIKSLENGDLTMVQINDIRIVLDEVTRLLNQAGLLKSSHVIRQDRLLKLSEWFETAIQNDSWPLEDIRKLAEQLYREYLYIAPPLGWYRASPEEPFRWAASHGLNTAQVLQRMLHPAQHTSRHLHNAIIAGLLHDLGMTRLPVRVLAAQERTNTTTKQQWRHHAAWLAERLRPQLKHEEFDVAVAIAQHHERLDGSGYPARLKGRQLIGLGKQLAVADSYAALCQARPHRPAKSARQATQLVLQEAKMGRLDEVTSLMLLPWGIAPVGSKVELSDGAEAEVISWDQIMAGTYSLRPVVALANRYATQPYLDLDLVRDRHIVRILESEQAKAG